MVIPWSVNRTTTSLSTRTRPRESVSRVQCARWYFRLRAARSRDLRGECFSAPQRRGLTSFGSNVSDQHHFPPHGRKVKLPAMDVPDLTSATRSGSPDNPVRVAPTNPTGLGASCKSAAATEAKPNVTAQHCGRVLEHTNASDFMRRDGSVAHLDGPKAFWHWGALSRKGPRASARVHARQHPEADAA
jgi:hypothetical protein